MLTEKLRKNGYVVFELTHGKTVRFLRFREADVGDSTKAGYCFSFEEACQLIPDYHKVDAIGVATIHKASLYSEYRVTVGQELPHQGTYAYTAQKAREIAALRNHKATSKLAS